MNQECDPRDIASKSFFLGPQAENGEWFGSLVNEVMSRWLRWRRSVYPNDGCAISQNDLSEATFREQQNKFLATALELADSFEREVPKFSPRYMGHMFSELSLPALIGHWIATLHNPNIISSESAPVGVDIEREAISMIAEMAGFPRGARGHFTSCGSIANLEAALRARDRIGGPSQRPIMLVPDNRHYSWAKACHILGLEADSLWSVSLNERATMDVLDLLNQLDRAQRSGRPVMMVVSVLGTTELGNFDPIEEIQEILDEHEARHGTRIWHHVDAAYGGFFLALKDDPASPLDSRSSAALAGVSRATSFTIDPHKLGYVPYACGAFLCRNEADYSTRPFDSPYIQYPGPCEPGPSTIEGSRSATGAAATWLTLKAIGAGFEGYGRIIGRTVQLREDLATLLSASHSNIRIFPSLQSNILCFTVGGEGASISSANAWVKRYYQARSGSSAPFFVSKTSLSIERYSAACEKLFRTWKPLEDSENLDLVRLTLMNPFLRSKEMTSNIFNEFCQDVARMVETAKKSEALSSTRNS